MPHEDDLEHEMISTFSLLVVLFFFCFFFLIVPSSFSQFILCTDVRIREEAKKKNNNKIKMKKIHTPLVRKSVLRNTLEMVK